MISTPKTIYLHIGTHKTGSTSLQDFLARNRDRLLQDGLAYYRGSIIDANHIEFYLSALDKNKDSLALRTLDPKIVFGLRERTEEEVRTFFSSLNTHQIIISSEGLSLLRSDAELSVLRGLLQADQNIVKVVCVLRDKEEYLAAYRKQITKVPGRHPSTDPQSSLYVEADSWLADYDDLISAFSRAFGEENVTTLDFDAEIAKCNDVLPATLRALNVDARLIPPPGSERRKNQSTIWNTSKQTLNKILSRFRTN